MPDRTRHPLTQAALDQLNAEIAARGQTAKSVAAMLDMNYDTFLRYTSGKREMPPDVLNLSLDALHLDAGVFWSRAVDRYREARGV
jgi:hypothetical protein